MLSFQRKAQKIRGAEALEACIDVWKRLNLAPLFLSYWQDCRPVSPNSEEAGLRAGFFVSVILSIKSDSKLRKVINKTDPD